MYPKTRQWSPTRCDERKDIIGLTTVDDAVVYADLTTTLHRCSRTEGLRISGTHLSRAWRAGAWGRPCSPCDGCRKNPAYECRRTDPNPDVFARSAGYLTRHVRRRARWCRGGAGAVRQRCLMACAGVHAPSVPSVQAMPDISSHVIRCIRS